MSAYGTGPYGSGSYGGSVAITAPGITVTADATEYPPRFEVTIATPDGAVMNTVLLTRTVRGVTTPTRIQPAAGFSTRFVPDPEPEWGVPVTYTATITTNAGTTVYTSGPAVLTPNKAWLVHPLSPLKSMPIDARDATQTGLRSIGAVTRPSTSTRLRPIGATLPVQVRSGSRQASQSQITVVTVTATDENNLWAAVDDQTPLLIKIPPSWGWNFEDGYYDIDGPSAERTAKFGPDQQRLFTFPIFRVAAPAGDQQATWSYADLLAAFPDYPSLMAAYADYPSLLGNNRR